VQLTLHKNPGVKCLIKKILEQDSTLREKKYQLSKNGRESQKENTAGKKSSLVPHLEGKITPPQPKIKELRKSGNMEPRV